MQGLPGLSHVARPVQGPCGCDVGQNIVQVLKLSLHHNPPLSVLHGVSASSPPPDREHLLSQPSEPGYRTHSWESAVFPQDAKTEL